jgi:hypothetical protein
MVLHNLLKYSPALSEAQKIYLGTPGRYATMYPHFLRFHILSLGLSNASKPCTSAGRGFSTIDWPILRLQDLALILSKTPESSTCDPRAE